MHVVDPATGKLLCVSGVTWFNDVAYVVCENSSVVHKCSASADTLSPIGEGIRVEGMRNPSDIIACVNQLQLYLYIADGDCIRRVSSGHKPEKWLTNKSTTDRFCFNTLSLKSGRLLVTSTEPPRLRLYSTENGQQLHCLQLPEYMRLRHAVETPRGSFVVCYYSRSPVSKLKLLLS